MRVDQGVSLGMVRVDISALNVLQLILVVALAIKLFVNWLLSLLSDFAECSGSNEVSLFESVAN